MRNILISAIIFLCASILALASPHRAPKTWTTALDPTITVGDATNTLTFTIVLTQPQNTIAFVIANGSSTLRYRLSQNAFTLNIPAVGGAGLAFGSTSVATATPGASVFSPWTINSPATFPSGTYQWDMKWVYNANGTVPEVFNEATGTFTVQ